MNIEDTNRRYFWIDFIKSIAVILIINSHMDSIYPVPALATGGALGNSIFFAASGYLIRGKTKNARFFILTFIKLYIPVYIMTIVTGLTGGSVVYQLVWPTNYWFVGAILLFYILYSIIERFGIFDHFVWLVIILVSMYAIYYAFFLNLDSWVVETPGLDNIAGYFKLIYYFLIMMIGGKLKDIEHVRHKNIYKWSVVGVVMLMYLSKFLMNNNHVLMRFQFLSQLCTLVFAICVIVVAKDSLLIKRLSEVKIVRSLIESISKLSLDLYVVQFSVIALVGQIVSFPASFFLTIVLIFLSGYILNIISTFLVRAVGKLVKKEEYDV